MADRGEFDDILIDLREHLTNCVTMVNILLSVRRNQSHLAQVLNTMLRNLCTQVEEVLPSFPTQEDEEHSS